MGFRLLPLLLLLGALPAVAQPSRAAADAPVATPPAQPTPQIPVSQMTRAQLQQEYLRLADSRPGVVGPAIMSTAALISFVSGAVMLTLGIYALTPAGAAVSFASATAALMGIGAALVAIAVVLGVIGGIRLFAAIAVRKGLSQQLDEINDLLEKPDPAHVVGPNTSWLVATF